ncbi:MAG: ATP synthase F1 subunit gamma [Patescibacteria group bacterium]
MASIQEIKRRIKAVTNTRQITKAMEMVSATKMRRSQETALLSRPFAFEALRILGELSIRTGYTPAIMHERPVAKRAIVVIASDRGLAGSFNTNVFRAFERRIENEVKATSDPEQLRHGASKRQVIFIAVGKKAEEFINRKGYELHASFKNFGDFIEPEEVVPLADLLVKGFLEEQWDRVTVVSTHFRTTLRQDVVVRDVLPISDERVRETLKELVPEYGRFAGTGNAVASFAAGAEAKWDFEYLIEPDPQTVLDTLAPELVRIMVYDLVLEANASEHSARMVAMKNASENAEELKGTLTLTYNKLRQASITREVAEIVAGAEALRT